MSLTAWRSVRRTAAVTALVAAGLLGTGLAGVANAATTNITGSVKTSGGTGVAGVTVAVKSGGITKTGTTTATGAFSISAVETGSATANLTSPAAPVAGLPRVWDVKNVSTSIVAGGVLNFTLPATT